MATDKIGLYVHVPFCKKKCNYCDFASFPCTEKSERSRYIEALIREIYSYKSRKRYFVDTVFFGGGTPSLLEADEFLEIYSALSEVFDLSALTEFTVEANPKTLTPEKISAYKTAGVNRISIGLQTIHENERKILGRIHDCSDFLDSLSMVRAAGINNINVDLMYGIPEQSMESFGKTLESVIALKVPHISVYGLMIEESTPFWKMQDSLKLPSDDEEAEMYFLAAKLLRDAGYLHYEISNYALPGFESQHNLKYWKCGNYIGLGLAAASYIEKQRFTNTSDLKEYLTSGESKAKSIETLEKDDEEFEFVMLSLRLGKGLSFSEYKAKFGKDFYKNNKEKIEKYKSLGHLVCDLEKIALTDSGLYISNSIICDFLSDV